MWRKCCYSIALVCYCVSALAVTQEGVVRSIARKGKPYQLLDSVFIRVKGFHNTVQSQSSGEFALLLHNLKNGDEYSFAYIDKSGYELSEQELIGKKLPCSEKVPFEILLVKSSDLLAEKKAIAYEARKNLEIYYQRKVDELKNLLDNQQLSEAEHKRRLLELEERYERFEPLVQSMSDKFARMDYERMDSLSRLIQVSIESGNPEETERLVREKGDLNDREEIIRAKGIDLKRRQEIIAELQAEVDKDLAMYAKEKNELAEDYYKMYASFLSRFMNDSAGHYIQKRAALDTLNVDYQLQAGQFVKEMQADYPLARMYFERAYYICLVQYVEFSGQMATTCHELGSVCKLQGDLDAAMNWYNRSLAIREKIRGKNSPAVAETLNNIGELYRAKKDLKQAKKYHERALKIRQHHFDNNSMEVAESKNNLAGVWFQQKKYEKAEIVFNEVKMIYLSLPNVPKQLVAANYNNLGSVSYLLGKYAEAVVYFDQAIDIYKKVLGEQHPKTQNALRNQAICNQKIQSQK